MNEGKYPQIEREGPKEFTGVSVVRKVEKNKSYKGAIDIDLVEDSSETELKNDEDPGSGKEEKTIQPRTLVKEKTIWATKAAQLFHKSDLVHIIPLEISSIELFGVILHEDRGRTAGNSGACSKGVLGSGVIKWIDKPSKCNS